MGLLSCSHGVAHICFPYRPQVTMATAQVLFQRFWYVTSLKQFGIKVSSILLLLRGRLEVGLDRG